MIKKKFIVAVTGVILLGFVLSHLLGNLQIFLGAEKINSYSAFLRSNGELLWAARVVLLVSVFLHIVYTIQLTRINRAARPIAYEQQDTIQSTFSSRFMIWSGLFLGGYIVYHILHLTTGSAHPQFSHTDIYSNIVIGFSDKTASIIYILAMISLGFHLHHGVFSVFQTLGLTHPKYNPWRRYLSQAIGVFVPLGYISIPVAVLLGFLHL